MSHRREFLIRHRTGFSEQHVAAIRESLERWKQWLTEQVASWATRGVPGTNPPQYVFHPLRVSDEGRLVSIAIEGDPGSYAALKRFEDGVPIELIEALPRAVLDDVELSLVDKDMGLAPGHWYSAKAALGY